MTIKREEFFGKAISSRLGFVKGCLLFEANDGMDIISLLRHAKDIDVGIGEAIGDNEVADSVRDAMNLLGGNKIEDARGIIILFEGNDHALNKAKYAARLIHKKTDRNAAINISAIAAEDKEDRLKTTIIAAI